ncbi:DUF547 domain-containing protein [Ulvibacter antarcticus]|uniref:Uncharacterized protein DUF547 n=1 Tax=Ulvibacter antarcticus TaxID=442714 RepID=A0A3L9Z7N1_9FLAO|nr:DUF547 domain-containing protein [Ulvibacter antarcticus]RMA66458.1 uncharacterized protein DUF547 [Ulvibacter antarcticus]
MKRYLLLTVIFFAFSFSEADAQVSDAFFQDGTAFFQSNVIDGKVDYNGIYKNPETLNNLLKQAETSKVPLSNTKEYQAFWINAYNLAVIKGIIDNYPIASPLDKKGFFDATTYNLGGKSITLNDIENKMLRANFEDARFHFVLVCGAKGCPPLISEAYTPNNIEKLLEQQTIKAINNSSFIRVSDGGVSISEIFKWYKEDFTQNGSSEVDFLNRYMKKKLSENAEVTYYSYDWRLNSK